MDGDFSEDLFQSVMAVEDQGVFYKKGVGERC